MTYKIPFYYAMKYLILCNCLETGEFYIRMKVFLLLCITYIINVVNLPPTGKFCPEAGLTCSNWIWANDHNLIIPRSDYLHIMNTIASFFVVLILLLNKPQSEFAGEMMFVIILSYWTNLFPLHFIYKLGCRAAGYCDLIATLLCDQINVVMEMKDNEESHHKSEELGNVLTGGLDYVVFLGELFIQGQFAEWIVELLFEKNTRTEEMVMQAFISIPTLVGLIVKKYNTNDPWYVEWLPELGIPAPFFPALVTVFMIPVVANPFYFKVSLDTIYKLIQKLGPLFFLKFFFYQAKLTLKFYMLTNDTLVCLKIYFFARVFQNLGKLPFSQYTFTGFLDTILMSFHQDYLTVLGSSSLFGRLVRYVGSLCFDPTNDDEITSGVEHIQKSMLGFIPTAYLIMGIVNVYSECDYEKRADNFIVILMFLFLIFLQYIYTYAWEFCLLAVGFQSADNNPLYYLKVFAGLALGLYLVCTLRCKTCDDEEYDDRPDNMDFLEYFAYHIIVLCVLSIIGINIIVAYYAIKYGDVFNVSDSNYEDKFYYAFGTMFGIELFSAFVVFEKAVTLCLCRGANRSLLVWMGALHAYCVFIERGYCLAYKLIMTWRSMKSVLSSLDNLDDNVVMLCSVCVEDILEQGLVSPSCGHAYHEFCIREWVNEFGTKCPQCETELDPNAKCQRYTTKQLDPQTEENAALLESVMEKFETFDEGITFFNERTDADGEEEEEEEEDEIAEQVYYTDENGVILEDETP